VEHIILTSAVLRRIPLCLHRAEWSEILSGPAMRPRLVGRSDHSVSVSVDSDSVERV